MSDQKMKLSWDDLNSESVEEKIKQQQAIEETRKAYESAPAPQALLRNQRTSIWYNTVFYMTLFGLVGGLCGWAIGELFHFRPDQLSEAKEFATSKWQIEDALTKGQIKKEQADFAIGEIEQNIGGNDYYKIEADRSLNEAERKDRERPLLERDAGRNFIANVLFYGICGLMIALTLGAADSIVSRNFQAAVINGAVAQPSVWWVAWPRRCSRTDCISTWSTATSSTISNMAAKSSLTPSPGASLDYSSALRQAW